MNRTFTLIVLLGLVIGTMLTGCNQSTTDETDTMTPVDTNTTSTVTN